MSRALLFLALLAIACKQGAAIKCYMCNSVANEHCGDPIDTSEIATAECTYSTAKDSLNKMSISNFNFAPKIAVDEMFPAGAVSTEMACQKMKFGDPSGKEIVMRACIPAGSVGLCSDALSSTDGYYCAECKTDGCNGAGQLGAFSLIFYLLLPSIAAVLMRS